MTLQGIRRSKTLSGDTHISFFTFSEHGQAIISPNLRVDFFLGLHVVRD